MDNIFNESQDNLIGRFSTLIILMFVYYAISYYGLLKCNFNCQNLPNFSVIVLLIIFHIGQVIWLRKIHEDELTIWCVLIAFGPVAAYLGILKYYEYMRKQQAQQMNLMLYQMQQQNQPQQIPQQSQPQPQLQQQQQQPQSLVHPPTSVPNPAIQIPVAQNTNPETPMYTDYISQHSWVGKPQPFSLSPF